jgi:flagellar basal-body rod protein FlgF
MDALTATAAAGIRSRVEALDLLANNLANANSTGYKADRELYRRYAADEAYAASTGAFDPATQPDVDSRWTDFSQGVLTNTGEPLDVAIDGAGFFEVTRRTTPTAPPEVRYTRDGHFRLVPVDEATLQAEGQITGQATGPGRRSRLETQDGWVVTGNDGKPIFLDSRLPIEFGRDGTAQQDGLVVNRIFVADPGPAQQLQKRSGNYFALDPPAPVRRSPAAVQQGKLETANITPAESAVRLINVMRQFESLQRAMQIGGEMNRRSVEEVAKFS